MFGIGLAAAYGSYTIDIFGGTSAALIYTLIVRLFVGIGWWRLFQNAGKRPHLAFIPIVGAYQAFRMVWDDFSFAAIFGTTTFIAWTAAVGVDHPIINACAVINFIMWWIMALLTAKCFDTNIILGLLYGGIPWFGVPLMGFWPAADYKGAWSSDPGAEQNLTKTQQKKRRKRAAQEERRLEQAEKTAAKREASKLESK